MAQAYYRILDVDSPKEERSVEREIQIQLLKQEGKDCINVSLKGLITRQLVLDHASKVELLEWKQLGEIETGKRMER